jgi:hypothetical protein
MAQNGSQLGVAGRNDTIKAGIFYIQGVAKVSVSQ